MNTLILNIFSFDTKTCFCLKIFQKLLINKIQDGFPTENEINENSFPQKERNQTIQLNSFHHQNLVYPQQLIVISLLFLPILPYVFRFQPFSVDILKHTNDLISIKSMSILHRVDAGRSAYNSVMNNVLINVDLPKPCSPR